MISRRALIGSLGALGAASTLAGCGTDSAAPAAGSSSAAGAFPATVTHKYGTTVVPAAPQRVVSVGVTEQDPLLALGVTPVGVTEWYGEKPYATWPWATDRLGDAQPTVLSTSDGFDLETIASLAPDLIVGPNSGMTEEQYAKLSALAPTIANSGTFESDWFEPYDVQTLLIGQALGRPAEAQQLVDAATKRFTDAATAYPQFQGKKAIFLQGGFYEGAALASPAGLGTKFLTDLGFVIPEEINPYVKEAQAYVPIEKLDVLDVADVLIWGTDDSTARETVTANRFYQGLRAVKEGRSVETGPELAGAIYFTTVLSLPYVADTLVPMLAKALPQ